MDSDGGSEGDEQCLPFRILQDKSLGTATRFLELCPTMDLVCVVAIDNQAHIFRCESLAWQKLLTISGIDSPVSSLCWRADGKVLAFGREDGHVDLYSVENGERFKYHGDACAPHKTKVTALQWVKAPERCASQGSRSYSTRAGVLLPEPVYSSQQASSQANDIEKLCPNTRSTERSDGGAMNILLSGDASGVVHLSGYGVFPLARISLGSVPEVATCFGADENNLVTRNLSLSEDLRTLVAVLEGGVGESRRLVRVHHNTAFLHENLAELNQLATQSIALESLLCHMNSCIEDMGSQWRDAIQHWRTKLKTLEGLLQDYGSTSLPEDELIGILVGGLINGPMHQFLALNLTEQGVSRVAKALDTACISIQTLCVEQLQRQVDLALFRLNELEGLAQWQERMLPLGLETSMVSAVSSVAAALNHKSEELLHVLMTVRADYHAFFDWLLRLVQRIADDERAEQAMNTSDLDMRNVSVFLRKKFNDDCVQNYFSSVDMAPHESPMVSSLLDPNDSLVEKSLQNKSVSTLSSMLAGEAAKLSQTPSCAISKEMRFVSCVEICQAVDADDILPLHSFNGENGGYAVYRNPVNTKQAVFLSDANDGIALVAYDHPIVKIEFCDKEQVAVLLRSGKGETTLALCQYDSLDYNCRTLGTTIPDLITGLKEQKADVNKERVLRFTGEDMTVNGTRWLAVVASKPRRVTVLDLMDEEEVENEDEMAG